MLSLLLPLAKRERVGAHAGAEELDLKSPVYDRAGLSDELIKPIVLHTPPSLGVGIKAVVDSGGLTIEGHAKTDRAAS